MERIPYRHYMKEFREEAVKMIQEGVFSVKAVCMRLSLPRAGLIHRSDRGSQYCALEYISMLEYHGLKISMSRKGNRYDNAPMESFWGVLKNEMVHHCRYKTRQETIKDIKEYSEILDN